MAERGSLKMSEMLTSCTLSRDYTDLELDMRSRRTGNKERTIHGWSGHDHSPHINVADDRQLATHDDSDEMAGLRGRYEYSKGIHMFEIMMSTSHNDEIILGIATPNTNLTGPTPIIGADDQSIGWNILKRKIFYNNVAVKHFPENGVIIPERVTLILDMKNGVLSFKSMQSYFGIAEIGLKRIARGFHIAAAVKAKASQLRIRYLGTADNLKMKDSALDSITLMTFHSRCGENVKISKDNQRTAVKSHGSISKATVFTRLPLVNGKLLCISIDKTCYPGKGNFQFGVTTNSPDNILLGEDMDTCALGTTWLFSTNLIKRNGCTLEELNGNLVDLNKGDTVEIKLEDGMLHFYINKHRQAGVRVTDTESKILLWAFVDINGQVSEISIVDEYHHDRGSAATENHKSYADIPLPKTENDYYEFLKSTIILMREKCPLVTHDNLEAINTVVVRLNRLYKVYLRALTDDQKRKAANKLAKYGGAEAIANYFAFLLKVNIQKNTDAAMCFHLLREVCFDYSENSLVLCKKFGEVGILESCIKDMKTYKKDYLTDDRVANKLKTVLGVLTNCSRVTENQPIFTKNKYMEIATEFTNPDDNALWACINTFLTMSRVYEQNEKALLLVPSSVANKIIECLSNALQEKTLKHGGWGARELINGLSNLSLNSANIKTFMESHILQHYVKMMQLGNDLEVELALNAAWNLITDENKKDILKTSELILKLEYFEVNGSEHVKNAALRIQTRLHLTTAKMEENARIHCVKCAYWSMCKRFLDTLNLSEYYFDASEHCCYCVTCHSGRGEATSYVHGDPRKSAGAPVGWSRFALSPPPKAKPLQVFQKWHRCFHGTRKEYIKGILEVGEIVPAGREVVGGKKIIEEPGHFNDERKPVGFDTKQIFLSPSIRYSGVDVYAKPSNFDDPQTKTSHQAKVVLQVLINPESYETGPETIGAQHELDPEFSNDEMEWSTNQQGSTILYGLLIQLDKSN